MKKLIGLAMTVLVAASSTFASGGISITISGNQGQIKTTAQEFRYSQSPRDLAGGQAGNLMASSSGYERAKCDRRSRRNATSERSRRDSAKP